MEITFNFTFFIYGLTAFIFIGIMAVVFKEKINTVIQAIEEKASGRTSH